MKVLAAGAVLLAAACTAESAGDAAPVDRLLVIDTSGAATMAPDGTERVDLDPGDGARFFQGAWSSDAAQLALSGQASDGAFVHLYPAAGAEPSRLATGSLAFYLYWEPGGERVAYLANGATGIDLRLITDAPNGPTEDLIGTGRPYYFDWDPAGDRIVTHVGAQTLELLTPGLPPERLLDDPAPYQAPQWSSDGGRILHAETVGRPSIVLTYPGNGRHEVIDAFAGFAYFSMDPTGERIAVATFDDDTGPVVTASMAGRVPGSRTALEADGLSVIDAASGDAVLVDDEAPVGFWWSPQGDALLYLSVEDGADDGPLLRWHVWESGVVSVLETFRPSPTFARDVLPFFDQYSRSMTLWSPDGTRFAYPGAPEDGRDGIWVHDLVTGERERVADGIFVAWSPR